jgi:glycosyltransferase involved in cell wall biosynthesis
MSYVGQSIDEHLGSGIDVNYEETPTRFYHIGRLDPSKNIELIIEVLDWYRRRIRGITLDLYGINSSWKSAWYAKDLRQKFTNGKYKEWIRFKGPITNKEIDKISQDYDVFIHGFGGSLDKALVEATVMKRFVITPNREYLQSFELDFDSMKNPKELMKEQLSKLQEMTSHELATEVSRRADIAISKHSLQNWLALTTQILTSNYGK